MINLNVLHDWCHIVHLIMTKAMPAIFVWFWVYVCKCMFDMTVFHICGSVKIIKNENENCRLVVVLFFCVCVYWVTVGCVQWNVTLNVLKRVEESKLLLRYGQNLKLTDWLTEFIKESPSWKADNSLLSQEIPYIFWSLCSQDTNTCRYPEPN